MTENQNTVNAEEALRSIATHPTSPLPVWYPPEMIEEGIQLVASRHTGPLLQFEIDTLRRELGGVCFDLRAKELKKGIKHDVDQILAAHAASSAVTATYTEAEVMEAVKVVRKRQGEKTIDPHWVRMKLEQELREARVRAEGNK